MYLIHLRPTQRLKFTDRAGNITQAGFQSVYVVFILLQDYNYQQRMLGQLAVLEVVHEDVEALRLDTVLLDDDAAAPNDLSGVALTVDLAETGPGAEDLGVSDLDEVDFVLSAERLDEFDVLGFGAGLDEHA
jgi:hypothetical protein